MYLNEKIVKVVKKVFENNGYNTDVLIVESCSVTKGYTSGFIYLTVSNTINFETALSTVSTELDNTGLTVSYSDESPGSRATTYICTFVYGDEFNRKSKKYITQYESRSARHSNNQHSRKRTNHSRNNRKKRRKHNRKKKKMYFSNGFIIFMILLFLLVILFFSLK